MVSAIAYIVFITLLQNAYRIQPHICFCALIHLKCFPITGFHVTYTYTYFATSKFASVMYSVGIIMH